MDEQDAVFMMMKELIDMITYCKPKDGIVAERL